MNGVINRVIRHMIHWMGMGVLTSWLLVSCVPGEELPGITPVFPYPDKAVQADPEVLHISRSGTRIYNGGYGSSVVGIPEEEGAFYVVTDRGPVIQGVSPDEKVFLARRFNPHIGKIKIQGDSLRRVSRISLNLTQIATGLPPEMGRGGTGEAVVDTFANALASDPNGIDPEGLALASDGTFWVCEEYRPSVMHVSASGRLISMLTPFEENGDGMSLPKVLGRRRPNRGLEGITLIPGGTGIVCVMESPLNNPDEGSSAQSAFTRLLILDTETGEAVQYLYELEDRANSVTDIQAITATSFLVIENDGKIPGSSSDPARFKRVYKIDIGQATDVNDPEDRESGLLVNGNTLEELNASELQAAGIQPVSKELVSDLLNDISDYPHDKPEGIVIINDRKIAVVNNDDFSVMPTTSANRNYRGKILPLTGEIDRTSMYFIDLSTPLK